MAAKRRRYRGWKYAALNLMVAKWLRRFAKPGEKYSYVTLGGTELYDIAHFGWIQGGLIGAVRSYEEQATLFPLAEETGRRFGALGVPVEVVQDDIFEYRRDLGGPHIYFIDLKNVCKPSEHGDLFQVWFEEGVLEPGDLLLVTSYLGGRTTWEWKLRPFDAEFRLLRIESFEAKRAMYEAAHPQFVVHQAMSGAGRSKDLQVAPVGFVKYFDTSTMGLYGMVCLSGQSSLVSMVTEVPRFDHVKQSWGL